MPTTPELLLQQGAQGVVQVLECLVHQAAHQGLLDAGELAFGHLGGGGAAEHVGDPVQRVRGGELDDGARGRGPRPRRAPWRWPAAVRRRSRRRTASSTYSRVTWDMHPDLGRQLGSPLAGKGLEGKFEHARVFAGQRGGPAEVIDNGGGRVGGCWIGAPASGCPAGIERHWHHYRPAVADWLARLDKYSALFAHKSGIVD